MKVREGKVHVHSSGIILTRINQNMVKETSDSLQLLPSVLISSFEKGVQHDSIGLGRDLHSDNPEEMQP